MAIVEQLTSDTILIVGDDPVGLHSGHCPRVSQELFEVWIKDLGEDRDGGPPATDLHIGMKWTIWSRYAGGGSGDHCARRSRYVDSALVCAGGNPARLARKRWYSVLGGIGVEMVYTYEPSIGVPSEMDREPPPNFDARRYVPSTYPGWRAPHVLSKDRTPIFDRYTREFTVVEFHDTAPSPSAEWFQIAVLLQNLPRNCMILFEYMYWMTTLFF
ncbi:hypothetical protein BJX63DRAFT_438232 [Aspergillus granulosus]|uniref:Uncharacterized protein n=1 Tax=Aspergillus granulosus TaxID=176169 RepID=A0ABR4GSL8_9EURO